MKQQTDESERNRLNQVRKISDEKRELEIKFTQFAESNNKQKSELHVQIVKLKRQIKAKAEEMVENEEKLIQKDTQINDLLEERKRQAQRMNDSQKMIENLENYKTRLTENYN